MLQQNRGKTIANIFIARACAGLNVFVLLLGSSALTFAAARKPVQSPVDTALINSPIDSSLRLAQSPISSIEMRRVNERNNAAETLILDEKSAVVMRNRGGFYRSLEFTPERFAALTQKLRDAGEIKSGKGAVTDLGGEPLRLELSVRMGKSHKTVLLDPSVSEQSLYTELMTVRNQVLVDGK
jgi:hypothetical protein